MGQLIVLLKFCYVRWESSSQLLRSPLRWYLYRHKKLRDQKYKVCQSIAEQRLDSRFINMQVCMLYLDCLLILVRVTNLIQEEILATILSTDFSFIQRHCMRHTHTKKKSPLDTQQIPEGLGKNRIHFYLFTFVLMSNLAISFQLLQKPRDRLNAKSISHTFSSKAQGEHSVLIKV